MSDLLAQISPLPVAPALPQVVLVIVAITLFAVGGALAVLRTWIKKDKGLALNHAAKSCLWSGIALTVVVLVWHAFRRKSWLPLDDNFDAFAWIAVLLAIFVAYDQRRRSVGGIDWFIMPIVVCLLIAAIAFGSARPHRYAANTWSWVHIASACSGSVAFAVAAASGATYLVARRRLRSKNLYSGESLGSLERLEHLTYSSASIGFALLTLATIVGLVTMLSEHRTTGLAKILLTSGVLLIYAIVLHAPINPSIRGRKTAILSIAGFVLMAVVLVVVQWSPVRSFR